MEGRVTELDQGALASPDEPRYPSEAVRRTGKRRMSRDGVRNRIELYLTTHFRWFWGFLEAVPGRAGSSGAICRRSITHSGSA